MSAEDIQEVKKRDRNSSEFSFQSFFLKALGVIFLSICMIWMGKAIGDQHAKLSIMDDCAKLNGFYVDQKIFDCKEKPKDYNFVPREK